MADRIRLYLDEDAQRTDLIQGLRARQIDVVTATEAELLGQPDGEQLRFAADGDRVVFTFNRGDFFQLHTLWLSQNLDHAGIILSDQLATGIVIRRLLHLVDAKSAKEMRNWLEFLSQW